MQCQPWAARFPKSGWSLSFRFPKRGEVGDGFEVIFDGSAKGSDLFLARVVGGHDIFLWIADAGISGFFVERECPDDLGDGSVHDRVVLEDHVERPAAHIFVDA